MSDFDPADVSTTGRMPGALSLISSSIRHLQDRRTRNLVRGILSSSSESAARRTVERLRGSASLRDAAVAFAILQKLPPGSALAAPSPFPVSCSEVERAEFYASAPLEIELCAQALRLETNADRLVKAIGLVGSLNRAILGDDEATVADRFSAYREQFGISFLIAQKAISLRHADGVAGDRQSLHGDVISPFFSPRRQVIAVAFEDSVDQERDYTRVRRTFLGFAAKRQLDSFDAVIVEDLFGPHRMAQALPQQCIQAYGRWSLVDLTAALFRLRRVYELAGRTNEVRLIDTTIPEKVALAWKKEFAEIDVNRLLALVATGDQFFDRAFFSHLPAWSEYEVLLDHRVQIESAVSERLNGHFPVIGRRARAIATPRTRVEDLLHTGPSRLSLGEIDPATSGGFQRTIALVAAKEGGRLEDFDGERLSALLDQTIDVAAMFSRTELAELLPACRSDDLYELLRTALVHDQEESRVSYHALRRSLQKVVLSRFDGDIVKLLAHVDSERHHVSKYLYNLCTEAFLTELYDLFEEADQVSEAHASILEWWGVNGDDADARVRARSSRLALRLRKVRGAIDQTRIYVDPLRFVAWIGEAMTGELRTLAVQADLILGDPDRSTSLRDRVRVAVQPRLKLLELLDRCYAEFCTNKLYGVTSFVGRRIRHGTLHGHLVLEFKPMFDAAIAEFRYCAPRFAAFLEDWYARLDLAVQVMAADMIHVRSKEKPQGLIVATVDEVEKAQTANRMVDEVAKSMLDRPQLALSASLIHEYCWLLFETDLKRTREAVEALRRRFVINVDEHLLDRADVDRKISERIRAINSSMQQRFETVRSWFTRPTNQSPSASIGLLFEAVLDEIRERFPGFRPFIDVVGDSGVDLIGHRFHVVYDVLYILVGNAAKHARSNGTLKVHVTADFSQDRYDHVSVSVRSDLDRSRRDKDVARIEAAMVAEIGDAMMRNKNSGLRKLREVAGDVEEIVAFTHRYDGDSVVFTVDMRYAKT